MNTSPLNPQQLRYDLGLDISTSVIGVCVLDRDTGNIVERCVPASGCHGAPALCNIKLTSTKFDNLWAKADEANHQLTFLLNRLTDGTKPTFFLPGFEVGPGRAQHWCHTTVPASTIGRIFVEENMKRFAPGFSSADTLITLAKFNGMVSYMARNIIGNHVQIINVNVTSARSKLGLKLDRKDKSKTTKEKVFEAVLGLHPEFPWETHIAKTGARVGQRVYDQCNRDMADAWVVVKGGQILHHA